MFRRAVPSRENVNHRLVRVQNSRRRKQIFGYVFVREEYMMAKARDPFYDEMDDVLLEIDFLQFQIEESVRRCEAEQRRNARRLLLYAWLRGAARRERDASVAFGTDSGRFF